MENQSSIYKSYIDNLNSIISQIQSEDSGQESIAKDERGAVSEIEKNYSNESDELRNALRMVRAQYTSVWESCSEYSNVRLPRDQHPIFTHLSWKECVRAQEAAASKIREWIKKVVDQAMAEKQRKLKEEEAMRTQRAAAQAEMERRRAEEQRIAEQMRSQALLEEMKNHYRRK